MPELPDITVYLEALEARIRGAVLERVRLASPFVLRSFDPPISDANSRVVTGLRRVGKRVVMALEGDLFLVIHLMIAGRLQRFDINALRALAPLPRAPVPRPSRPQPRNTAAPLEPQAQ